MVTLFLPPRAASFDMKISVDGLFFIGMQLVAISNTGKVAVWQSVQKHWQLQDVEPICSYDMAASFLLLGCTNGSIYYIGEFSASQCRLQCTCRCTCVHLALIF